MLTLSLAAASTRPTWPDILVFAASAAVILVGALGVVTSRNPVHAALSLVMTLFGVAVLFIEQEADFLAAVQIIVYAGAIMVLFVFTVMLLNAGREERTMGSRTWRAVGFPAVVTVFGVIATVLLRAHQMGNAGLQDGITSTEDLSRVLFHELLLPFEVTSVLILIAILGSVALARHGHGDPHGDSERTGSK
jgi:NADH-quinone oxidoreductase subunit J